MPGSFAWLDHDEGERRKMLEVVNLFREKGTVDELGIGTIRDAYSEHFFPGTSTIQTRTRYFLLVPWMYLRIEAERVPSAEANRRARRYQADLARALRVGGGTESGGVIGIQAGENLQRPPSIVYWSGLRRWGIRLFDGSLERYHAGLDAMYRAERGGLRSDDGERELIEPARRAWHAGIPDPPSDLWETASLTLTRQEAAYLQERILLSAPGTLLAWLAERLPSVGKVGAPWELSMANDLPGPLAADVEHARLFSLAIGGAPILYNLMLAERSVAERISTDADRIHGYRAELARWTEELRADVRIGNWNTAEFWVRTHQILPRLRPATFRFANRWIDRSLARTGDVGGDAELRQLIAARERAKKGPLARLHNRHPLERWSGRSGIGRLTYRWREAQVVTEDLQRGFRNRAGT